MGVKPKRAVTAKRTRVVAKRSLLHDIRGLIEEARSAVAATVNAGLTMFYWQIGERINAEILKGARAEYGKQIIATLSQDLSEEYERPLPRPLSRRRERGECGAAVVVR